MFILNFSDSVLSLLHSIVTATNCMKSHCTTVGAIYQHCIAVGALLYLCTSFTPQIKGYSQCIYHILHWFWNANITNKGCRYLVTPFLKVLKIFRFLWFNPLLFVSLYKMHAWIRLWKFIIAEVMSYVLCTTATGYTHHCHPRGSETLFQGKI